MCQRGDIKCNWLYIGLEFRGDVWDDDQIEESDSLNGKESTCNAGDPGSIPGSGRSPGEGMGYPLQYSWASLVAQLVKNQPAMWEIWVQSLCWEGPVFWPGDFHELPSPTKSQT